MGLWVLVVSSDVEARGNLSRTLEAQGCELMTAPNITQAMELLRHGAGQSAGGPPFPAAGQSVKLVFCDRDLPDGNYHDFLTAIRGLKSKTRVVVTSRLADWDEYLDAMRLGAFDVIAAPCRPADVEWTLLQARRDLREAAASGDSQRTQPRAAAGD